MNSTHGAMHAQYYLMTTLQANVVVPQGGMIGACMLVLHLWVSLVVNVCDMVGSPAEKHAALLKNAYIFKGSMKTLEVG